MRNFRGLVINTSLTNLLLLFHKSFYGVNLNKVAFLNIKNRKHQSEVVYNVRVDRLTGIQN